MAVVLFVRHVFGEQMWLDQALFQTVVRKKRRTSTNTTPFVDGSHSRKERNKINKVLQYGVLMVEICAIDKNKAELRNRDC